MTQHNNFSSLIQEQLARVAQLQINLQLEQDKLQALKDAVVFCDAADAAKRKIKEGKRELAEAIAQMPPEVAALFEQQEQQQPQGSYAWQEMSLSAIEENIELGREEFARSRDYICYPDKDWHYFYIFGGTDIVVEKRLSKKDRSSDREVLLQMVDEKIDQLAKDATHWNPTKERIGQVIDYLKKHGSIELDSKKWCSFCFTWTPKQVAKFLDALLQIETVAVTEGRLYLVDAIEDVSERLAKQAQEQVQQVQQIVTDTADNGDELPYEEPDTIRSSEPNTLDSNADSADNANADWFEIDVEVFIGDNEEDEWFCYDEAENHQSGHAVYFRRGNDGYNAIALIMEGDGPDPRSWAIETVFLSQESAFVEAQNFMARIEEGEFEETNPFTADVDDDGDNDDGDNDDNDNDDSTDSSNGNNDNSISDDVRRAIAKIVKKKQIDRISKETIWECARIVGVESVGTKEEMAEDIRLSGIEKRGQIVKFKFYFSEELAASASKKA